MFINGILTLTHRFGNNPMACIKSVSGICFRVAADIVRIYFYPVVSGRVGVLLDIGDRSADRLGIYCIIDHSVIFQTVCGIIGEFFLADFIRQICFFCHSLACQLAIVGISELGRFAPHFVGGHSQQSTAVVRAGDQGAGGGVESGGNVVNIGQYTVDRGESAVLVKDGGGGVQCAEFSRIVAVGLVGIGAAGLDDILVDLDICTVFLDAGQFPLGVREGIAEGAALQTGQVAAGVGMGVGAASGGTERSSHQSAHIVVIFVGINGFPFIFAPGTYSSNIAPGRIKGVLDLITEFIGCGNLCIGFIIAGGAAEKGGCGRHIRQVGGVENGFCSDQIVGAGIPSENITIGRCHGIELVVQFLYTDQHTVGVGLEANIRIEVDFVHVHYGQVNIIVRMGLGCHIQRKDIVAFVVIGHRQSRDTRDDLLAFIEVYFVAASDSLISQFPPQNVGCGYTAECHSIATAGIIERSVFERNLLNTIGQNILSHIRMSGFVVFENTRFLESKPQISNINTATVLVNQRVSGMDIDIVAGRVEHTGKILPLTEGAQVDLPLIKHCSRATAYTNGATCSIVILGFDPAGHGVVPLCVCIPGDIYTPVAVCIRCSQRKTALSCLNTSSLVCARIALGAIKSNIAFETTIQECLVGIKYLVGIQGFAILILDAGLNTTVVGNVYLRIIEETFRLIWIFVRSGIDNIGTNQVGHGHSVIQGVLYDLCLLGNRGAGFGCGCAEIRTGRYQIVGHTGVVRHAHITSLADQAGTFSVECNA